VQKISFVDGDGALDSLKTPDSPDLFQAVHLGMMQRTSLDLFEKLNLKKKKLIEVLCGIMNVI
jgi:hypothetical protein